VVTNEISGASLSSNQITLPAGTYFVEASALAVSVNGNRLRFYNVTDGAVAGEEGQNAHCSSGTGATAVLGTRFTIASQKVFELDHYTQTGIASFGLGINVSTGTEEIYADVKVWKIG
jgi:hypothetical protein